MTYVVSEICSGAYARGCPGGGGGGDGGGAEVGGGMGLGGRERGRWPGVAGGG